MSERLIITNGGAAVEALREAGVAGKVLSWDDVLHDGPVPGGISDAQLREVRAEYLAGMGPEEPQVIIGSAEMDHQQANRLIEARDRLRIRDATVEEWRGPILLWFEHDLYDQLQLIQILDRLKARPEVRLIQMGDFVTTHSAERLGRAEEWATPVTAAQFEIATAAWSAFRDSDPRGIAELAKRDSTALPFLAATLGRWLEMFPGQKGVSLTEGWVLDLLSSGPATGASLFRECQAREEAAFRGDWSFWGVLRGLEPLVVSEPRAHPATALWSLSEIGAGVQKGEADRVEVIGIDRWLGGTHITAANDWRWIDESLVRHTNRT